jgi:hypothetical protein
MAEKSSDEWMTEVARKQEELQRLVDWAQERGITEDQKQQREKAARAVFNEAFVALGEAIKASRREFDAKK